MINPIDNIETQGKLNPLKMPFGENRFKTVSAKSGINIGNNADTDKSKAAGSEESSLKKAATDFETIFVTQMIKDMWKTMPVDDEQKEAGSEIYMEMMQSALASELSKGEGLGIGKMLYQELSKTNKGGQGSGGQE